MNFANRRVCRLRAPRREGIVVDVLMILAILALLTIAVLFSVRGIRAESRGTTCWGDVVVNVEPDQSSSPFETCR